MIEPKIHPISALSSVNGQDIRDKAASRAAELQKPPVASVSPGTELEAQTEQVITMNLWWEEPFVEPWKTVEKDVVFGSMLLLTILQLYTVNNLKRVYIELFRVTWECFKLQHSHHNYCP